MGSMPEDFSESVALCIVNINTELLRIYFFFTTSNLIALLAVLISLWIADDCPDR